MRLTDRSVQQLPPPARGNKVTYDATVKGFGCRVTAAGARAFVLNYRRKTDGRQRRFTIGSYPDWSVGAARDEAKRLKREIDGGADPVGELERSARGSHRRRPLRPLPRGPRSRASAPPRSAITASRSASTSCPLSAARRWRR